MKTRYLVFLSLVAGAFLLPGSGCGGAKSCQDACEAREACPDVIPGEKSCELQCKDEEALVKVALCEEQQQVYREELRKDPKLRVLLAKAVTEYKDSLSYAAATGVDVKYLADAKAALERLQKALEDGAKGEL